MKQRELLRIWRSLSQMVRMKVSEGLHECVWEAVFIYIRKVHFRDTEMIRQIESKVVNRLRQVTSAIKQEGAYHVVIISSTAVRQAVIALAKVARQIEHDLVVPILASTGCDYQVPLSYPDEVIVGATTVKVGRTSFTQEPRVWSTAQKCESAVGGTVVSVDKKSGKTVPAPEDVRGAIERVEKQVLAADA